MYKIINLISLIGVLIMNGMANALPIGGRNTGEISDLFPNLFTPAGLTFSIWGVIYLFLTLFCLYPFIRRNETFDSLNRQIFPWFVISCLANMSWILAWHNLQIELSLLIMLMILISLIIIYRKLADVRADQKNIVLFLKLPFSIYLGWISVATIANTTIFLVDQGIVDLFGRPEVIFVIILLVAFSLGILFLQYFHDTVYALVLIWAFIGIHIARMQSVVSSESWAKTALMLAIALGLFIIWKIIRLERLYLKEY